MIFFLSMFFCKKNFSSFFHEFLALIASLSLEYEILTFQLSDGTCYIWGKKAKFVPVVYIASDGKKRKSKLLTRFNSQNPLYCSHIISLTAGSGACRATWTTCSSWCWPSPGAAPPSATESTPSFIGGSFCFYLLYVQTSMIPCFHDSMISWFLDFMIPWFHAFRLACEIG